MRATRQTHRHHQREEKKRNKKGNSEKKRNFLFLSRGRYAAPLFSGLDSSLLLKIGGRTLREECKHSKTPQLRYFFFYSAWLLNSLLFIAAREMAVASPI